MGETGASSAAAMSGWAAVAAVALAAAAWAGWSTEERLHSRWDDPTPAQNETASYPALNPEEQFT